MKELIKLLSDVSGPPGKRTQEQVQYESMSAACGILARLGDNKTIINDGDLDSMSQEGRELMLLLLCRHIIKETIKDNELLKDI